MCTHAHECVCAHALTSGGRPFNSQETVRMCTYGMKRLLLLHNLCVIDANRLIELCRRAGQENGRQNGRRSAVTVRHGVRGGIMLLGAIGYWHWRSGVLCTTAPSNWISRTAAQRGKQPATVKLFCANKTQHMVCVRACALAGTNERCVCAVQIGPS